MLNLIGIIEKKNRLCCDAGTDEMNCWLPFIRDIKKYGYRSYPFLNTLKALKEMRESFQLTRYHPILL